jgi:hypothetical protein
MPRTDPASELRRSFDASPEVRHVVGLALPNSSFSLGNKTDHAMKCILLPCMQLAVGHVSTLF